MANWDNPQLTSTYTNFLAEVKARDDDIPVQFSTGTISNQPNGAIKWDSSANIWKKWDASGSSWGALTGSYAFPAITATTGGFSSNVTITGTLDVSSTISGTSFIPDGSTVPSNGIYLPSSNTLGLSTGSIRRASLNSTGLKLGTGTAGCKLDVDGGIKVAGGITNGSHGYGFGSNDTDGGMYSPADNQLTFKTNNARRVTISGDKVGINIDGPQTHLHVKGGGANPTTLRIENNDGSFNLSADADKGYYYADKHVFKSQQGSGDWAYIDSSGLGIGAQIPTGGSYIPKMYVYGDTKLQGNLEVTGNITGVVGGVADRAIEIVAEADSGNADHFVTFADGATGDQKIKTDTDFKYNPSSNTLTVANLNISGSGGGVIPIKGIIAWSGSENSWPTGWSLCNGQTVNGHTTPDLRGRFILGGGSGSGYSLDARQGYTDASNISHTHTSASAGAHQHSISDPGHHHLYDRWYNQEVKHGDATNRRAPRTLDSNGGVSGNTTGITILSNGGHSHTVNSSGISGAGRNMPPYHVLCYIMRTS